MESLPDRIIRHESAEKSIRWHFEFDSRRLPVRLLDKTLIDLHRFMLSLVE